MKIYYFMWVPIFALLNINTKANIEKEPVEERFFQTGSFQKAINTTLGVIATVGTAKVQGYGNDFWLCHLDADLDTTFSKTYGGNSDDEAHGITQTFDGGFVMVGSTLSADVKYGRAIKIGDTDTNKKRGLILKVDERGKALWHCMISDAEDVVLYAVVQLKDGSLLVGGKKDERMYLIRVAENGGRLFGDGRTFGSSPSAVTTLLDFSDGHYAILGYQGEGAGQKARYAIVEPSTKTDLERVVLRDIDEEMAIPTDAIYDVYRKQAVVIGHTNDKGGNLEDLIICRLNSDGKKESSKRLTYKNQDLGGGVDMLADGTFVLSAKSNSYKRVAFKNNGMLLKINETGEPIMNEPIFLGTAEEDYFLDVVRHPSGAVFAFGNAAVKGILGQEMGWAVKLPSLAAPRALPRPIISVDSIYYIDGEQQNDTLNSGERAYIAFEVKNHSSNPVLDLQVKISIKDKPYDLFSPPATYQGHIASNSSRKLSIPVRGGVYLPSEVATYQVTILSSDHQALANFDLSLPTKRRPLPQLEVYEYSFIRKQSGKGQLPGRLEPIQLEVTVINRGDTTASRIEARFYYPYDVDSLSNRHFYLTADSIAPGETYTFQFLFQARSQYEYDSVTIYLLLSEDVYHTTSGPHPMGIRIEDFYLIKPEGKPAYMPSWRPPVKGGSKEGFFRMDDFTQMDLLVPAQEDVKKLEKEVYYKGYMLIRLQIDTDFPLDQEEIMITDDGTPLDTNRQLKEYTGLSVDSTTNGVYHYTYDTRISLNPGLNYIAFHVRKARTDNLKIRYKIPDRNLYLISVGIPYEAEFLNKLKYTTTDAGKIAEAFEKEEGDFFKQVYIDILTSSKETTKAIIINTLRQWKVKVKNNSIPHEYDPLFAQRNYFLIFFSAHGRIDPLDPSNLHILDSNYGEDRQDPQLFCIDIKNEILAEVNDDRFAGEKLILIDACRNGLTGSDYDEKAKFVPLLDSLLDTTNPTSFPVYMLASSSPGEYSYELQEAQSGFGVFTRALLDALSYQRFWIINDAGEKGEQSADTDHDCLLTVLEISLFIRHRVAYLLKQSEDATRKQTPVLLPRRSIVWQPPISKCKPQSTLKK